ncbi:PEP-CTERM sorting domain-containing protein [Prosthecobacter sp.]|uniref:PEP-CTERM sorting domain-containing protein n=1 Tax=Prosthecobacter sp. TaxID=1965333 RepID=UPI002AB7FDBA|nr:PEP-CTERM sorting domain-containing protein [Prosthecobacter sp.]MDZ4402702.1 PEP-CTERM sorting domain-containing protein [Prosthecobacter sp.]
MKTRFHALVATLLLSCPVLTLGSSGSLADVLVLYNFNQLANDWDSNIPDYCAPCVWTTDLALNTLNQGLHTGGPDGSKFRCFEGWDFVYDYSLARTDLSQAVNTLSYDVFVRADAMADISGVSLDWQRPGHSSADAIQASIFWEDSAGAVQHRTSGPVLLGGTGSWNSLDLDFSAGSSALPTGLDTSGKQFHVELYAWGKDGDALYLDNIVLKGLCAPIPEPGGALLIAAAGMAFLLRRRVRG